MFGVKSGINTWNKFYGPIMLNLIVLGIFNLFQYMEVGRKD